MTPEQAAEKLNGNYVGEEGSEALFDEMKKHGLVAVFGASDDLMEFRGAIYEESGAYNGTTEYVDQSGLVKNGCLEGHDCPNWKQRGHAVTAIWNPENSGASWIYETVIPHVTFDIMEDDELFCKGIVFRLADAAPSADSEVEG